MKRTLVIGDIHGCYDELQALLDRAGLADDDRIIALGDIVDRGPTSRQVLDFFAAHPTARSLMGNHERKHVRAARGELKLALSQEIVRYQYWQADVDYTTAVSRMASFPLHLDLPDALLVHGFFEPGVPLAAQRETVLAGTMGGDLYLQQRYTRPWYELYDGDKPLIVGHHNYLGTNQPFVYQDRVYCLDTSCCHGLALTGLLLPDFRVVSVPARADHWTQSRQQLGQALNCDLPLSGLTWNDAHRRAAYLAAQPAVAAAWRVDVAQLQDELAAAQTARQALGRWLQLAHETTLAALRHDDLNYDMLPSREQAKRYHARIQHRPAVAQWLLHAYRQGRLSQENLAEQLDTVAGLLDLAETAVRASDHPHHDQLSVPGTSQAAG